jgi:hypothetical protein
LPARRGHARVELANRTGCGVARGCVWLRSRLHQLLIEVREIGHVHQDFAAERQQAGGLAHVRLESERDGPNRTDVLRDAFALLTVPAGNRANQQPVLIHQFDRGSVELRFQDVDRLDSLPQCPTQSLVEADHIFGLLRRVEREERGDMLHRLELLLRRCPDSSRRRVVGVERRVLCLECLESAKHRVVLRVADLRSGLVIVEVCMPAEVHAKRVDFAEDVRRDVGRVHALLGLGRAHGVVGAEGAWREEEESAAVPCNGAARGPEGLSI